MKIKNYKSIFTLFFLGMVASYSFCQDNNVSTQYRRSSVSMVLIENENLGDKKGMVTNAYYSNPFPDKYNNHEIADKKFDAESMKLTTQDFLSAGFYKDTLKSTKDFLMALKKPLNTIRYTTADSSRAVQEPSKEELTNIYIQKYIKDKNLAKQIVATWFDRKPNGEMSWDVIKKRGMYSASTYQSDNANSTFSPEDFLLDFELIGNTYTVFNRLEFYPNEPLARLIRDKAREEAILKFTGKPEALLKKANQAIDTIYVKTKEGYTVACNTYLYQLEWNDSIVKKTKDIFFNNAVNYDKVKVWDTLSLYKMNFVGKTKSSSIVTFKLGEKRTEEQIIDLQIKRTVDNALTKLQKEYVQFRPISPIESINPLTVKIGLKEGVESGQQYEILKLDETGLIPKLVRIETVSIPKKVPIWDNRQGANGQDTLLDESGNPIITPEFTTFNGGKKASTIYFVRLLK